MLGEKNVYHRVSFKTLKKGDVFRFTTVGKFYTVFEIDVDGNVKYNTTFGRSNRFKTDLLPIDKEKEVLVYPERKRNIRHMKNK